MTRNAIALLALLSMCHPAATQALTQPHPQPLASYVDKNRILLIFAPGDHDPTLQQQLTLLRPYAADLKDRDLILLPIVAHPGPPASSPSPILSASGQLALRRRFHISPDAFAAILLGKDGGEKLRSATPITAAVLNRTIDAMPMRQQEQRERTPKP